MLRSSCCVIVWMDHDAFLYLLLMAHSDSSKWCCSMTVLTDVLWGIICPYFEVTS